MEISLYKICLKRVVDLVVAKTWNSCSINPFLNIPSRIADDLMKLAESDIPKISEVYLILASGSLTHLHLNLLEDQEEMDLFQHLIQRNCFKSLRVLTWDSSDNKILPLVENLIQSCPKLEEFRSFNIVRLEVFINCKELRVLKFYVSPSFGYVVAEPDSLAVLASLKNLQVFFTSHMNSDVVAKVLKHCPNLLSLEYTDSLTGLEKIYADSGKECETNCTVISQNFRLKRCVWGEDSMQANLDVNFLNSYKYKFPEKIKIAVSLCPFVEELLIYVNHPDSIETLKNLKHLTCLKINFDECDGEYMTHFLALLRIIGHRLKHISVDCTQPAPVDIICDCCPRLESFEITGFATASKRQLPHNSNFLRNLRIMEVDQNAVFFLLTSCKNLVELFLYDALCLDDNLLSEILKWNLLAKLKNCEIIESSLSKEGFRMFLENVVSLHRVHFAPFQRDLASVIKNLITELNLTNVIYGEMFDIPNGAFGFISPFSRS